MLSKNKQKRIKIRNENPNFSMHVRKTPTLIEKQRKAEKKHKKKLISY